MFERQFADPGYEFEAVAWQNSQLAKLEEQYNKLYRYVNWPIFLICVGLELYNYTATREISGYLARVGLPVMCVASGLMWIYFKLRVRGLKKIALLSGKSD